MHGTAKLSGILTVQAARGESPAAFDQPCIPSDRVAPRSNTAGLFPRRALSARRKVGLGATRSFHHGLLEHGRTQSRRNVALEVGTSLW